MQTINKQQILFFSSTLVGFFLFYTSYTSKQIELFTTRTTSSDFSRKSASMSSPFPERNFYSYWSGKERYVFRKVDNYKKLPPSKMAFPQVEISKNFYLLPLPVAKTIKIIAKDSFSAIEEEIVVPEQQQQSSSEKEYSRLAKILLRKVLKEDVILMNNGKKFSGKIISENRKEVIIHVVQKKTNYNLPKKQIQKIYRQIDIENVCKREAKRLASLSLQKRLQLASACAELEQHSLAQTLFKKTLEKFPNEEQAFLGFVDYWLENLNYEQASHWIEKAHQSFKNSLEIERKYAQLLSKLNFDISFLKTFQKSQKPQDVFEKIAYAIHNHNYTEAQQQLALIADVKNENDKEGYFYWKAYLEYIEGKFPSALKTSEKIAKSAKWLQKIAAIRGAIFYLQGDLPKAREVLLPNAQQGDLVSLYNLALVYLASNAAEEAQKILDNLQKSSIALSHNVTCAKAYIAYVAEEIDTAIELAEKSIKESPKSFLANYVAAEIYYQQQNVSKAYELYSRALQLRFSFTPVLVRLAEITYRSNNIRDSFVYIEELLKRQDALFADDVIRVYNLLSQIYIQQQQYAKAKEVLQKSIQVSATNTDTLKLFAILANQSGDYDVAASYLNKVLQINANDEYAKQYTYNIKLNKKSIYWEDTFSRKGSNDVRRGWFEEENNGIVIQLRNSQVFFSGTQRNNSTTQISRQVPEKRFLAISADITTIAKAYVGIIISSGNNRLLFGKDPDNDIGYGLQKSETVWEWNKIENFTWPKDPVVRLKIKKLPVKKSKDSYEMYINDQMVKKFQTKLNRNLQTGFFGKADFGIPWSMHVDNARIVELKE
ncbi:tetratricopeptide repeat protein [Candidatus Uabimicrobium amorphum]|uniref:Lipopolysaccharide assembly protein B n=1 Tax=Uabimicrobium amorphum TaxID=2596890 RepID=A0A5S9F1U2_UABAM|nr:hypothetical protein [Candidatus Uabimicrobium amorphum]BBM82926.1 lipopolysaccharide assembly protein B [Candidatus Uabimicrobium amorphum]